MGFWDEWEAAEAERLAQWLDVPPALCARCGETRRGVLLGICAACLKKWRARVPRPAGLQAADT